jgi:hypothetical protein
MAFPWTFQENFESGTKGDFNSESDTNGVLNFRNYKKLARTYANNPVPFRGAYALEVDLNGATTDQYVQEDDGFDVSLSSTLYVMFTLFVTTDLVMAASDRFTLFTMQSTGPVDEAVVDIRNNAGVIEILASETGAGATVRAAELELGKWHIVELTTTPAAGTGTIDFFLNGRQVGAQITTLTQAAIIQGRLGVLGKESGTTTGRICIGEILSSDARLYPYPNRFANPKVLTKSEHLFVGPGHLDWIALMNTTADNVVKVYDTDKADTLTAEGHLIEVSGDVHRSFSDPTFFKRGCYIELAGTTPRIQAKYIENSEEPGVFGPGMDDGQIRNMAFTR